KKLLDIAPQRQIPRVASESFRTWAGRHSVPTSGGDVILWVDTFNNSFHPDTARAALDVLRAAGCRVFIPRRRLCCGRPLYAFGLLDRAKTYLRDVLDALAEPIDAGIPVVVLEPSCASVFRDEFAASCPTTRARSGCARRRFCSASFSSAR